MGNIFKKIELQSSRSLLLVFLNILQHQEVVLGLEATILCSGNVNYEINLDSIKTVGANCRFNRHYKFY